MQFLVEYNKVWTTLYGMSRFGDVSIARCRSKPVEQSDGLAEAGSHFASGIHIRCGGLVYIALVVHQFHMRCEIEQLRVSAVEVAHWVRVSPLTLQFVEQSLFDISVLCEVLQRLEWGVQTAVRWTVAYANSNIVRMSAHSALRMTHMSSREGIISMKRNYVRFFMRCNNLILLECSSILIWLISCLGAKNSWQVHATCAKYASNTGAELPRATRTSWRQMRNERILHMRVNVSVILTH